MSNKCEYCRYEYNVKYEPICPVCGEGDSDE